MSFSEFTEKDFSQISVESSALMEAAGRRCRNEKELETVRRALDFACEAHKNVRRRSGVPYVIHPIAVARIVIDDIGLGYKSICAALLHDVTEDTNYSIDDIRQLFGDKIGSIVEGLGKIKTVLDNEDRKGTVYDNGSEQVENFRKILLTLGDDTRVVLIKLADRLHNCRTIEYLPEHKRDKILSETMYIFVPLSHRLGLYGIKSEMENIWLRYKEPDAYLEISRKITRNVEESDKEIDTFIAPIAKALDESGIRNIIIKRIKTPYSIWHKMRTKQVPFEQIYDLYAVRIIFTPDEGLSVEMERKLAFDIYVIVSSLYREQPGRLRDWIRQPKSNGYEALHCTLMSDSGIWIEVQIRSRRMDDIAEKGIAAHWAYKRNGYTGSGDSEMDKWLSDVKDILVSREIGDLDMLDIVHQDLLGGQITVFTPKGEQKQIAKGATALDFAYLIHTEIGNKAIAAKVNLKLVPLSQVLKTGDQIEIITAENTRPKMEWFNFLKTRHAQNQLVNYFHEDRASLENKRNRMFPEGTIDRKYVMAECCHPIPGDPVIGFKASDGTIIVHKKSCSVAENLLSKYEELVSVPQWTLEEQEYPTRISIRGIDRVGLLNDITHLISLSMGVNMRKIQLGSEGGITEGFIELMVKDKSVLDNLTDGLKKIKGIQETVRTEI